MKMYMKMLEPGAGPVRKAARFVTKQDTHECFQNSGRNIDCLDARGVCSFTLEPCCMRTASTDEADSSMVCPYTMEKVYLPN